MPCMHKRFFLSNLLLLVLLNLLVKPFWIFMIDRNVQLHVGHDAYGVYAALLNLSIIFGIVLDVGITNFNNRHIAEDTSRMQYSLPNLMVVKCIFLLIYYCILLGTAYLLHYTGYSIFLLFLLGTIQFLNSFVQFLRSNISASQDFKRDGILSVMDKIIMILLCGYLLWNKNTAAHFTITWYLYAQIVAYGSTVCLALWMIRKTYTAIHFNQISRVHMKNLLVRSLPYALLILLMGIYMRSDVLLLERFAGAANSSMYVEAYRVLDAFNMIGFLFAGVLLPLFTRMLVKKIPIQEIATIGTNIIFSMAISFVAFSFFYQKEIMLFLDPHASPELPSIYFLVITTLPAFCIMYIYSTLLTANGNIRTLIYIAACGCVVSIALNSILIPTYAAFGAAITGIVVQYLVVCLSIWACFRNFSFTIHWLWIFKFMLLLVLHVLANAILHQFAVSLFMACILNFFLFFITVYAIKLWDQNTIRYYMRQYRSTLPVM